MVVFFNESTSIAPLSILNTEGFDAFMAYVLQWDEEEDKEKRCYSYDQSTLWVSNMGVNFSIYTDTHVIQWGYECECEFVQVYRIKKLIKEEVMAGDNRAKYSEENLKLVLETPQ